MSMHVIDRTYLGCETREKKLNYEETIEGFCNIVSPVNHKAAYDVYVAALRCDGSWDYIFTYRVGVAHKDFRLAVGNEAFTNREAAFAAFKEAAEEAFKKNLLLFWSEHVPSIE